MSEEPARHVVERKNSPIDLYVCLGLAVVVIVFFAKTVFLGAPISKIHVMAEWDSIFKNFALGKSQLMDPSQILLMVPYYLMVGRMWHCGDIPLWNAESGFGAPLLADPQALAFSVLHFPLALHPAIATYNYILIFELIVVAVGGFVLGKTLGLTRYSSVFLGVTLLCCPFEQWYLELLGNGYCLLPLLLAAFLHCARRQTIWSAVVAGISASALVLSAHPELSFCSVTVASLMLLTMIPFSNFRRAALLLLIAGAVAFCLSAPMILPFIELLVNSDSYKFGNRAPAYYPWQTLAFNFIQPGYAAASPYFGVLAAMVMPFGLATIFDAIRQRGQPAGDQSQTSEQNAWVLRASVVTGAATVFAWAISAKVYPLGMLLTKRPFSYVVVTYFFPVVIVLVAALAAFGLERLISILDKTSDEEKRKIPSARYNHLRLEWLLMLVPLGLLIGFPPIAQALHLDLNVANFDMTLGGMELAKRDWVRGAIVGAVIFGIVAFVKYSDKAYRKSAAAVVLLIAAGLFSQVAVSKGAMPTRPLFAYPQTETIKKLQSLPDRRVVFTGEHTMRPNTNLVYSIRDVRFHNPIFPRYYIRFLEKAGAKLDEFNQVISNSPSKMLDAASVSYFITTDKPLDDQSNIFDDSTPDIAGKRFKRIAETSEGMHIYENVHAVPDSYIVTEVVRVESDDEALNAVAHPDFEPNNQVVLQVRSEDKSSFDSELRSIAKSGLKPSPTGFAGTAIVANRESSNVSILTDSNVPAILVLTDVWYPGWEATVDGKPATIARANYSFRAICLPQGKHTVEFSYRPKPFYLGCGLALVAQIFAIYSAMKKRNVKQSGACH